MKRKTILTAMLTCSIMLNAQTKESAVVFYGGSESMDASYLLSSAVSVSFDENGKGVVKLGDETKSSFAISNETPVVVDFRDAFKITANQDPKNTSNYYSTFFSEKSAYVLPETGVTAYAGVVDDSKLKMTGIGTLIHKGEPVLLKGTQGEFTLMPRASEVPATETNNLTGTEEGETDCASNVYALSYGQNGVGFYMWKGKDIGANKAYLILPNGAKALSFEFGEGTLTGINNVNENENENENLYNLKGMKVDKNYKGIVVNRGKKYIVK